jgi:hypothetical protein
MDMISARMRKDGNVTYRARVTQNGVTYHDTETFDSRPATAAWMKKRQCGLLDGELHDGHMKSCARLRSRHP